MSRREAVAHLFGLCSQKYGDPDISKMPFTISDRGADPNHPLPVYMSCHNKVTHPHWEDFCGPGHTFHHWNLLPDTFEVTTKKMSEEGKKNPIMDKVGWYGNISTTMDAPGGHVRLKLKELADANPELFDVVDASKTCYKTMSELTRDYRYLIDVGGNGYSGRLKYLMFSRRPLIVVDRLYIEYYHSKLIPYMHYIPVKMDLSDLLDQVGWMKENEQKCSEIASNAFDFATKNFSQEKILERIFYVYNKLIELKDAKNLKEKYEDKNVKIKLIKGNFQDTFEILITSNKKLFVTRTDKASGWGQNLRVVLEQKNTGREYEIEVGSSSTQTKSMTVEQYISETQGLA